MPSTYHDFDPWRRAAENISQGLVAAQQARANAAMRQQEMQQRAPLIAAQTGAENAQAEHYRAQTGLANEQTLRWQRKGQAMEGVKTTMGPAMTDYQKGLKDSPAIQAFVENMAAVDDSNPEEVRKSLSGALSTGAAAEGNARMSALFANPESVFKTEVDDKTRRKLGKQKDATAWELGTDKIDTTLTLGRERIASQEKRTQQVQGNKSSGVAMIDYKALRAEESELRGELRKQLTKSVRTTLEKRMGEIQKEIEVHRKNILLTEPAPSGNSGATPATNAAPVIRIVRGEDGKLTFAP